MDAKPLLVEVDVFFRKTPRNMTKVKAQAEATSAASRTQALKAENERALLEPIRRWQALPPERRTHFLPKRAGARGSAA